MGNCPRCNSKRFWQLSTGQRRCVVCGLTRKFNKNIWRKTRISPYWKGRLLEFFCLGVPAYRLRFQVPLNIKTTQRWFRILREAIYIQAMKELSTISQKIETGIDKTIFNEAISLEKKWSKVGKLILFGIRQKNGKILTFPVDIVEESSLVSQIIKDVRAGTLYYPNKFRAYAFLDIHGDQVILNNKEGGRPKDHLDSLEGFWSYTKHWLYHQRGVPEKYFHLYLKEIEWRFNHRNENLAELLRGLLNKCKA